MPRFVCYDYCIEYIADYAALLAFSCLAIERTIAVYWPLKSKHILGPRFTVLLLLAVPGLCVIAFSPIFYLVYTIHLFPTYAQVREHVLHCAVQLYS